jgi:hypothetical protein
MNNICSTHNLAYKEMENLLGLHGNEAQKISYLNPKNSRLLIMHMANMVCVLPHYNCSLAEQCKIIQRNSQNTGICCNNEFSQLLHYSLCKGELIKTDKS